MRLSQLSLMVGSLLITSYALGSEHGVPHGLDEHTIKTIIYQSINVTILIAGLLYFLRHPVKEFFKNKKKAFEATAERALALRKTAEKEREEIQIKLSRLEGTADESLSRARAEAADMKKALIAEAHSLSKRIHEEAAAAAKLETEKAKNILREQMIKEAAIIAAKLMTEKLNQDDQKRLQGEFIEHIRAVRQ